MNTVSVVVATYNGKLFIEEQLDSIRFQSRQPDEVLIYDDCSKDNTVKFVSDYINKFSLDNSWRIEVNKSNKGYAKNFMDLSKAAKGDLVFFCDQDDIWNRDKIRLMSEYLDSNNNIDLLCSNLELFYSGEGGRKWDKKTLSEMKNDGSIDYPKFNYENFFCRRSGCTMCVRKEFINKICDYWVDQWAHDDFFWKMSVLSNSCAILNLCTIKRRMHANNASSIKIRTRNWRINQIYDLMNQNNSLLNFAKNNMCTDSSLEIIYKNIECLDLRMRLLKKHNLFLWMKLYRIYKNCYPRRKALLLDLYLSVFKSYSGVN